MRSIPKDKTAVVTSRIAHRAVETRRRRWAPALLGDIEQKGASADALREQVWRGFVRLDVTDPRRCRVPACLQHAAMWMVATSPAGARSSPSWKHAEFWRKVIDLLRRSARLPNKMTERGAEIVVVASDAGRVGSMGETVYSGAKGGAIAFTKSLAREVARYNINVNAVCPGPTDTPLLRAVPEKHQEAFVKATPMRRLAKPSEIADAVLFFASDRARFVTGQVLSVSGGLTLAG